MMPPVPESKTYEYGGLKAQAWDLLRGDYSTWPDRPFYLAAIGRYGEPALDVGCGTGRLLLDYLAAGHRLRRRRQLAGDARPLPTEGEVARARADGL